MPRSARSYKTIPAKLPANLPPGLAAVDPRIRAASLLGLLVGILVASIFAAPSQAHPIEYLLFIAVAGAVAYVMLFVGLNERQPALERALCSVPAMAVFALALFALVRWQALEVPSAVDADRMVTVTSPGRSGVIGFQLMALGLVLGFVLGGQTGGQGDGGGQGDNVAVHAWRIFRRVLIVGALAFAILAFYQYFVSYDRALASLKAADATMDPLLRQSLEHALAERRVGGNLGNGNVFAALLSVLAVFCISGWSSHESRAIRGLSVMAYAGVALATLLTGSRGGLLTFALATSGALALLRWMPAAEPPSKDGASRSVSPAGSSSSKPRKRKRKKRGRAGRVRVNRAIVVAFLLFAALSVATVAKVRAESPVRRLTKISTIRERLTYWRIAVEIGSESPWLGRSPGAFQLFYPRHKPPTARESRYAHSWVFQTGSELGLVGLGLFGLFWLGVAKAGVSIYRCRRFSVGTGTGTGAGSDDAPSAAPFSDRHREAAWLVLGAAILGVNGLFEYSLQLEEFSMMLGVLAGGAIVLTSGSNSVQRGESAGGKSGGAKPPSGSKRLSYRLVAGLTLFLLATSALGWQVPHRQMGIRWKWRAEGSVQEGDHESAARYYARASSWQPDEAGYLIGRSAALGALEGRGPQALKLLAEAKELNPVSARIRQLEARILEGLGEFEEALARLDEAVELYPNDAGYRLDRAASNLRLGHTEAARADLESIEDKALPIWTYQRPTLNALRAELGMDESST